MIRRTSTLAAIALLACSSSHPSPSDSPPAGPSPAAPDTPPATDSGTAFAPIEIPLAGTAPFWAANVGIGGQSFRLNVDTGSTTTVVAGAKCSDCGGARLYQPGAGAVDEGTRSHGVYDGGDMSWSGEIMEDSVEIGSAPPVRVRFGVIDSQTNFLSTMGSDGILGLGPTRLAAPETTSVLDSLVAAGMPDVFAVKLCVGDAHLWLGGFDAAAASAPVAYAPLLSPTKELPFYDVKVAGMAVAGRPLDVPAAIWGPALVDTGAPGFSVPQAVLDAIVASLGENGEFAKRFGDPATFYANDVCVASTATAADIDAALPPLSIDFGDSATARFTLTASQSYLVPSSFFGTWANAKGWCPGIGTLPGVAFDVGDSLLRSLITVFDRANGRIGFAPHAG
jgi:hypothetical protein